MSRFITYFSGWNLVNSNCSPQSVCPILGINACPGIMIFIVITELYNLSWYVAKVFKVSSQRFCSVCTMQWLSIVSSRSEYQLHCLWIICGIIAEVVANITFSDNSYCPFSLQIWSNAKHCRGRSHNIGIFNSLEKWRLTSGSRPSPKKPQLLVTILIATGYHGYQSTKVWKLRWKLHCVPKCAPYCALIAIVLPSFCS